MSGVRLPISSRSMRAARRCWRRCPRPRRTPRSAFSTGWRCWPGGSGWSVVRCSGKPSVSCTAPRLRPTRSSNARAPGRGSSPPKAIATSSRCARGSRTSATICACRRPSSWCRAICGLGCASGCAPTAGSKRRSMQHRSTPRSRCCVRSGSRRSRSLICTLGATRAMNRRHVRRCTARCPERTSRYPPKSCRRSRSSSGSRRQSSTPMSSRCCRATSRDWRSGSARRAIAARF